MTARDTILQAVGQASTPLPADQIEQKAQQLLAEYDAIRPQFDTTNICQHFLEKATTEALTATAEHLESSAEIPQRVHQYLQSIKATDTSVSCGTDPYLLTLHWHNVSLTHQISANVLVSLTLADQAIAETGSILVHSRPEQAFLLNYIGLHHIIIIRESTICAYMEDIEYGTGRSTGIITGTSGTADIEGKITRGAHGPRYMHLLLIKDIK